MNGGLMSDFINYKTEWKKGRFFLEGGRRVVELHIEEISRHPRWTVFDQSAVAAMEKARGFVEEVTTGEVADDVSRLSFPPHRPFIDSSFYEFFAIRGIRLTVLHSDFISCSFKVPPRLVVRQDPSLLSLSLLKNLTLNLLFNNAG